MIKKRSSDGLDKFRAWPIQRQILVQMLIVFFIVFIVLFLVSRIVFTDYYNRSQIADYNRVVDDYYEVINSVEDNQYYEVIEDFAKDYFAYTLIYDNNYELVGVDDVSTTYTVHDDDTDYVFVVRNLSFSADVGDNIQTLYLLNSYDDVYEPCYLRMNNKAQIDITYEARCEEPDVVLTNVRITDVNLPSNLNHLYSNDFMIYDSITRIDKEVAENGIDSLVSNGRYTNTYQSSTYIDIANILALDNGYYATVVVHVNVGANFAEVVSIYIFGIYLFASLLVIIGSIFISRTISAPLKDIAERTRQLAKNEYNHDILPYNNVETLVLSESLANLSIELETTHKNLTSRNEEIFNLYKEQQTQTKLKKQFVSSVSHELKTPLMIISIILNGLKDGIIDQSDLPNEVDNVIKEVDFMKDMIQDMLDIFKIDAEEILLNIEKSNMSDLVYEVTKNLDILFKDADLECIVDVEEHIVINVDSMLMSRVVQNFITNALKYTPPGNKVCINGYSLEESCILEVINEGITIDEEHLKNIFNAFYKVDKSGSRTENNRSTGLGLYIVEQILTKHGLEFGIENIDNAVRAYIVFDNLNKE